MRSALNWWAEGWVIFVRSAGGRPEDMVGLNPAVAAMRGKAETNA
jgi:hypothetical protein